MYISRFLSIIVIMSLIPLNLWATSLYPKDVKPYNPALKQLAISSFDTAQSVEQQVCENPYLLVGQMIARQLTIIDNEIANLMSIQLREARKHNAKKQELALTKNDMQNYLSHSKYSGTGKYWYQQYLDAKEQAMRLEQQIADITMATKLTQNIIVKWKQDVVILQTLIEQVALSEANWTKPEDC